MAPVGADGNWADTKLESTKLIFESHLLLGGWGEVGLPSFLLNSGKIPIFFHFYGMIILI